MATGLGSFRRAALFALVGVLAVSVAARAWVGASEGSAAPSASPAPAAGFVAGSPAPSIDGAQDPSGGGPGAGGGPSAIDAAEPELSPWLPVVTESSFFALIGFALGFATRKVLKLVLVVVALFFVALQGLVHAGVAEVDWGRAIELFNALVLDLREEPTWLELIQAKLPTAGGLAGGYLLGFRRG